MPLITSLKEFLLKLNNNLNLLNVAEQTFVQQGVVQQGVVQQGVVARRLGWYSF